MIKRVQNKTRLLIIFSAAVALTTTLSGCVQVEPWDRGFLAKDHMAPDPYPSDVSFQEHANFSREGTMGGFSPDAGGCGCN